MILEFCQVIIFLAHYLGTYLSQAVETYTGGLDVTNWPHDLQWELAQALHHH